MKTIIKNIYHATAGTAIILSVVFFLLALNHGVNGNSSSFGWYLAGILSFLYWLVGVILLKRDIKRLENKIHIRGIVISDNKAI